MWGKALSMNAGEKHVHSVMAGMVLLGHYLRGRER